MTRLLREIYLCLAVITMLLIGGALVLLLTKALEGFALIDGKARG